LKIYLSCSNPFFSFTFSFFSFFLKKIKVFYGHRSLVFPEAENRKYAVIAVFEAVMRNLHDAQ